MDLKDNTEEKLLPGTLYIVSLPLGNLGDITYRAVETLQTVDYVLAEDTRQVHKLTHLLSIPKLNVRSYRDQTHERIVTGILADLAEGKSIALVSDRGTPTISDPGYKLVRDTWDAGFAVTSVPGASAVIAALSISGLPTDRFVFLGFLPRTAGKQKRLLREHATDKVTFIVYESPYRIQKLIKNIQDEFQDDVDLVAIKELTKLNERVYQGTPSTLLDELGEKTKLKGEWVVLGRIRC